MHTPGPWWVYPDEDGDVVANGGTQNGGLWKVCGTQNYGGPDDATCAANAKLIAAAPDMLKALQMVRDALNGAAGPDGNRIVLESSEVAYAIAKATT